MRGASVTLALVAAFCASASPDARSQQIDLGHQTVPNYGYAPSPVFRGYSSPPTYPQQPSYMPPPASPPPVAMPSPSYQAAPQYRPQAPQHLAPNLGGLAGSTFRPNY